MKTQMHHRRASVVLALLLVAVLVVPAAAAGEGAFDVRFSGVIDGVPENLGDPWTIAGQVVAVDEMTQVVLTTGTAEAGMWAHVQARRLADDSLLAGRIAVQPPEMRLKGPVQDVPEGNLGDWIIADQSFLVDAQTRINLRPGPIGAGTWVEVIALESEGDLRALRIHAIEADEDVEVHGAIQAFGGTWKISSVQLAANEGTLVIGDAAIGLLATALATLQEDDTLLARTVKVSWVEPQRLRPRQPVQFRGTIETLPTEGLIGTWTVSGQAVEVTDTTRIFQIKGLVAVGAEVHIVGWREDGQVTAAVITVLQSPLQGGWRFQLRGEVVALPPLGGPYGPWVIDQYGERVQVLVHLQTRLEGAERARVGAPVEVGGVQLRNGVLVATWLRIRDMSGPGPGPQP